MIIRKEDPKDYAAVHAVNATAFETEAEANLVDLLRTEVQPIISLVAEEDQVIVGHILFSPVSLSGFPDIKIMGLGPLAVIPKFQRKGIGSALTETGLEMCKVHGYGAVIVLGHPEYYPRFGFRPSVLYDITCEYDVPEDVFMVNELQPGYLDGSSGIIKYHPAFANV
jgi:putative acetyltransferase